MMSGLELFVVGLVGVFVAYKIVDRVLPQGGEDAVIRPPSAAEDVAPLVHDRARVHRLHLPGAQRSAVRRRVLHRGHGRSQAG